jgi:hypothetical protein
MQIDVLVTANIQGNLDSLPRLYTALRRIKDSAPGTVLLMDVGRAWSANSWICQMTENRAPYIALDAMGYDAAFVDGLSPTEFDKVNAQVQTQLVVSGVQFNFVLDAVGLSFVPDESASEATMQSARVRLPMPSQGTIHHLRLDVIGQTIAQQHTIPIDATILPDPTIAGAVDFIVSEARYYQKKREAAQ